MSKLNRDLDNLLDTIVSSTSKTKKQESKYNDDLENTFPTRKQPSLSIPRFKNEKEISDVSDADDNDIDRILKDTEDLDGDLFKGMSKNNNISLSKTLPSSINNPKPQVIKKIKSFDEEDDDPLAGIDNIMKRNTNQKNQQYNDKKPPLSSTLPSKLTDKPKTSIFDDVDDSDLLGGEKPRYSFDSKRETPKRTLADNLFGGDDKKQNDNESKLVRNSSMINASNDQLEVSFSGYVPTLVNDAPRQSKRNVKFIDDLFNTDTSADRPKTSPAQSTAQQITNNNNNNINTSKINDDNPLTKSLPSSKSNYDWLSLSDDNNNNKINDSNDVVDWLKPKEKPQQQSQIIRQSSTIQQQPQTHSSINKSNDWLGLKDSQNSSFEKDNFDFDSKPPKIQQQQSLKPNSSFDESIFDKEHNQGFLKPPNKSILNSSFADSVENINNTLQTSNLINTSVNNIGFTQVVPTVVEKNKDLNYQNSVKTVESASETGSDYASAWLDNMINSKKNPRIEQSQPTGLKVVTPPVIPQLTSVPPIIEYISNANDSQEMQLTIKQLMNQNRNLQMQIEYTKSQYDFELQMVRENCNNRLKLMKENIENTHRHFEEEKDVLNKQIDLIEKEKYDLIQINRKKCEEIQKECNNEIEKLKEIQKKSIDNLKYDHELTIKRIKELKDNEIDAAMTASSHTRTIETVLTSIQENTKNIDDLSQKVQINHMVNLTEKETEIKIKEENLKLQEERLLKRIKEYETESKQLRDTIQRLENHLAEQIKQVEEEKWKGKQQEKKMEALQDALLNEQKITMEKLTRERMDIDRVKEDILNEQRRLMQQVYEEKRKIAEERANLDAQLQVYKERQHKDSLSNLNIEAGLSVTSKFVNEEKSRLERLENSLKLQEEQLKNEKSNIDERRREIDMREAKLEQMAFAVKQKYVEAENLYTDTKREKEKNSQALKQVNTVKQTHESRLQQIQQQLALLNETETRLNQEKVGLFKLQQELELNKEKILCTKCKKPVKNIDAIAMTLGATSGYGTILQTSNLNTINGMIPTVKSASNERTNKNFNYTINTSTIDEAKALRQLKLQALKDRQYLNQEKEFISTLNRSHSLNQLNKLIS